MYYEHVEEMIRDAINLGPMARPDLPARHTCTNFFAIRLAFNAGYQLGMETATGSGPMVDAIMDGMTPETLEQLMASQPSLFSEQTITGDDNATIILGSE